VRNLSTFPPSRLNVLVTVNILPTMRLSSTTCVTTYPLLWSTDGKSALSDTLIVAGMDYTQRKAQSAGMTFTIT
jgi:hypothetical protein